MDKINKNLNDVTVIMEKNVSQLISRGYDVDHLCVMSDNLVQSSEMFVVKIIPWYKRLFLWISSCWWFQKKKKTPSIVRI